MLDPGNLRCEAVDDIPDNVKLNREMDLPIPLSEVELKGLSDISRKNQATEYINFIGAGAYDHHVPA